MILNSKIEGYTEKILLSAIQIQDKKFLKNKKTTECQWFKNTKSGGYRDRTDHLLTASQTL